MGFIKMGIWLCITVWLIIWINRKKERMLPVCILYYFMLVINDIFFMSTLQLANAFGISYQMGDMMIILFASILIIDIMRKTTVRKNFPTGMMVIIAGFILFSCIRGVLKYSTSSDWFGDTRTLFGFLFPILWFSRFFRIEYIKKYIGMIEKVMRIIFIITLILWVLDIGAGLHPLKSQYDATLSDGGSTMRFVAASQVFVIALYSLYLVRKSVREHGYINFKAFVYLGVVVFFQHRSVWMALALGMVWIIVAESKNKKHTMKLIGQILLLVCIGVTVMMTSSGDLVENIKNSWGVFLKMMSGEKVENSTAGTRQMIWDAVLSDLDAPSKLVGRPFGYGYARSIGWTVSPHSGYICLIARIGYIGISLIIALIAWCFYKTRRKIPYIPEFILCMLGFLYAYNVTWICGCIIGGSVSVIICRRKRENNYERSVAL